MEPDDSPLSKKDLEEQLRSLSRLSEYTVRDMYRRAHEECRMKDGELPNPQAIQELVQIWKQLWKWRKKGSRRT